MTRKDIGIIPIIHPLPVLIISANDKNDAIKAMNAVCGQVGKAWNAGRKLMKKE